MWVHEGLKFMSRRIRITTGSSWVQENRTMWIYSTRHPTAIIRKQAYGDGRVLEEWQVHKWLGTCSSTVCKTSMQCGSTQIKPYTQLPSADGGVNLSYPGQGSSLQTLQPRMKRRDALLCALTSTASLPQMLANTHRFTASDISNSEGLKYGAMSCSTISTTDGV